MAPRSTPTVSKRMSTDTLLDLTDKVAAELARRIEELQEGHQKLGVEGLRLQSRKMQRVVVRFPEGGKKYEYNAPIEAQVGDTVRTPTSFYGGPKFAEIISLGTGGYSGQIKDVLNLYRKVGD